MKDICEAERKLGMTVEEALEIFKDFGKCYDLAQRLDAAMPEAPGAFTGTVSERLFRAFERMRSRGESQ